MPLILLLTFYGKGVSREIVARTLEQTEQLEEELWVSAIAAASADPQRVPTGPFVQTLNDVISDLDRPRQGLTRVSQQSMISLRESMERQMR